MSAVRGLRIVGARQRAVKLRFEGAEIDAFEGETVAVALLTAGIAGFGRNRVSGEPRGIFCAMRHCQECAVLIEGHVVEACRTLVRAGLDVRSIA